MKNQEMQKKPKPKCVRVLSIPKMLLQLAKFAFFLGKVTSTYIQADGWGQCRQSLHANPLIVRSNNLFTTQLEKYFRIENTAYRGVYSYFRLFHFRSKRMLLFLVAWWQYLFWLLAWWLGLQLMTPRTHPGHHKHDRAGEGSNSCDQLYQNINLYLLHVFLKPVGPKLEKSKDPE